MGRHSLKAPKVVDIGDASEHRVLATYLDERWHASGGGRHTGPTHHDGHQEKVGVYKHIPGECGANTHTYTTRWWSPARNGWHFWVREFAGGVRQPVGFLQVDADGRVLM